MTQNLEPDNPSAVVDSLFEAAKLSEQAKAEFFRLKKWQQSIATFGGHQQPEPLDAVSFALLAETLKLQFDEVETYGSTRS